MSDAAAIVQAGEPVDCRPWPRFVLARDAWQHLVRTAAPPLLALWADTAQVHALFVDAAVGQVLLASCAVEQGRYPALSPMRPAAAWFERMVADLWGHTAEDGIDARPWLDHGRWPHTQPMGVRPGPPGPPPEPPEFLPVEGAAEGGDLHQVPVGPIHAAWCAYDSGIGDTCYVLDPRGTIPNALGVSTEQRPQHRIRCRAQLCERLDSTGFDLGPGLLAESGKPADG